MLWDIFSHSHARCSSYHEHRGCNDLVDTSRDYSVEGNELVVTACNPPPDSPDSPDCNLSSMVVLSESES